MYLGIILACMSIEDASSCVPLPNVTRFYETQDECYEEANAHALNITQQANLSTAVFCYQVHFFQDV